MTCLAPNSSRQRISVAEAKKLADQVTNESIQVGDVWCLIAHAWWMKFMAMQEDVSDPTAAMQLPPISNEAIVRKVPASPSSSSTATGEEYELKASLVEGMDYVPVPEHLFTTLVAAFGVASESRDVIKRNVIEGKIIPKDGPFIEVYELEVKLANFAKQSEVVTLSVSQATPIEDVRTKALEALGIAERARRNVQFLIKGNWGRYEAVSESKLATILATNTVIYVDESGMEVEQQSLGDLNGNRRQYSYYNTRDSQQPNGLCGLTGLQNLGNTCFMNSALQCLSNTPELTQYFLAGRYHEEINTTNVLGTGGKLVRAYAELLQEMWSGQASSVRPYKLKNVIGQFAPRFNGYAQQDSQELTSFLLDGLHEDLNRVLKKPYIEEKEGDGHDDIVVADEAWKIYKMRNDSIIVDLMHGQLKSKLFCPVCNKISVKFDPVCFLSIPVPAKEKQVKSTITLVRGKSEGKWAKFVIMHTNKTTVREAIEVIRENLKGQIPPSVRMVLLLQQYTNEYSLMDDDAILNPSGQYMSFSRNFYAYIVGGGSRLLTVYNRPPGVYDTKVIGVPLILDLKSKKISRQMIYDSIVPIVSDMLWKKPVEEVQASSDEKEERLRSLRSSSQHLQQEAEGHLPAEISLTVDSDTVVRLHESDEEYSLPDASQSPLKLDLKWSVTSQFQPINLEQIVDREINMMSQLRKSYTLRECLDMFTKEEQLDESEAWYCPGCKKHQRAFKKLDLWSLPQVLIIHLKRFQYSRFNRDKIDTPIDIPTRAFDLSDKIVDPRHRQQKHLNVYDLIAMSNHSGGLGSGHYTAMAMNNNYWCDFNDSSAYRSREQMPEVIASREAYILYYRRRPVPEVAEGRMTTRSSSASQQLLSNRSFGSPPVLHHPSASISPTSSTSSSSAKAHRTPSESNSNNKMDVD